MAESMGCLGITVNKPSELASALDQAFDSGRPAVVDVKTHVEGIAPRGRGCLPKGELWSSARFPCLALFIYLVL